MHRQRLFQRPRANAGLHGRSNGSANHATAGRLTLDWLLLLLLLLGCWAVLLPAERPLLAGPEIPGAQPARPVAIVGADLYCVDKNPIRGGRLIFHDGRITALGADVPLPDDAEIIDAAGKRVYPGLFNAAGHLGLVEINSVRATNDMRETGQINPNAQAAVAVNPDSELIPVTRANGVLLALTSPDGGLISGMSAVIQLDGWTWEEMALQRTAAMHVAWPTIWPVAAWWTEVSAAEQRRNSVEQLDQLEQTLEAARRYQRARRANSETPVDLRWEALLPVLEGTLPLVVEADRLVEIESAVAFAAKHQLRLIIRGGYDAPHCAQLLRDNHVPVIVQGVLRLPLRRSDPYDQAYKLPELLRQAGVTYCIAGASRFDAANMRNLPYHAATAAAYGLPESEALKAVTLYPAEILGVADRVGSLAVGKDATLLITDGDVLETPTHVLHAFVAGKPVDLSSRHTRLYEKYREKYRRLREAAGKNPGK